MWAFVVLAALSCIVSRYRTCCQFGENRGSEADLEEGFDHERLQRQMSVLADMLISYTLTVLHDLLRSSSSLTDQNYPDQFLDPLQSSRELYS